MIATRAREAGFHIWMVIIILAAVGVIGLLVWRFIDALESKGGPGGSSVIQTPEFLKAYECDDKDVSFTSPPLKMEDLGYIRPLGAMLDGHVTPTDHVYVGPVDNNVPDNTYPVIMPADGRVVEVGRMPDQYIGDRSGTELAPEDHRLIISFSCRYYAIFIHVHKLSDPVKAAAGELQPSQNKMVSVELKAGDTVGYIGGSTFDWTPIDVTKKLTGFITPDLYKQEPWKIYTVSPFDLYTGELKTQMEAKSWRTVAPLGGKIDYDQPGKLIGTWFREGTNGYEGADKSRYWDGHLSVVPDYIDPSYTVVSIGNWNGKATQLLVEGSVDPATVKLGDEPVTWELRSFSYATDDPSWFGNGAPSSPVHPQANGGVQGTIMFQVLPGEKLKVETFPGKTAEQVSGFTSAAQTYER